jgi:hypothetical protein
MSENPKQNETIEVLKGLGLSVLLHLIQAPFLAFGPILLMLIGASQLIYQVPAFFILRSRGRMGMAKGILIGGSLTLLLNAACFGLFMSMF